MGSGASKTTGQQRRRSEDCQGTRNGLQEQNLQRKQRQRLLQHPQQRQQQQQHQQQQQQPEHQGYQHTNNKPATTISKYSPTPPATKKKEYIPDTAVFAHIDDHALKAPKSAASSIENLVNYLTEVCSTDLEKVRVLFRWITNNIKHDVENYLTGNIQGGNNIPDAVVLTGCACAEYGQLFQDMCRHAGIVCEKISGYSKGASYSAGDSFDEGKESSHTWNAVYVDNSWRLIDCTWATGYVNSSEPFQFNENYFLTDPEEFIYSHLPYDTDENLDKWQLLDSPWALKQFEEAPSLRAGFGELGIIPSSLTPYKSRIEFQDSVTLGFSSHQQISVAHKLIDCSSGQRYRKYSYLYVDQQDFKAVTLVVKAPSVGDYKLSLFAGGRAGDKEKLWLGDFLLRCTSVSGPKDPYPTAPHWGLTAEATALGLSFKGLSPSVTVTDSNTGLAKVEFNVDKNQPLIICCTLSKADGASVSNSVLRTHTDDGLAYLAAVPSKGLFRFTLFVRPVGTESWDIYRSDFLIESPSDPINPTNFPLMYNPVRDCQLLEPMQGTLPADTEVRFRLVVPDTVDVAVVANNNQWHHLDNTRDDIWEGTVPALNTEGDVSVYKKTKQGTLAGLLKYTIGFKDLKK